MDVPIQKGTHELGEARLDGARDVASEQRLRLQRPCFQDTFVSTDAISGEVSRGEKIALRGTDPESHVTEYTQCRTRTAPMVFQCSKE